MGSAVPSSLLYAPLTVRLHDPENIYFDWQLNSRPVSATPKRRMLDEFLRLAAASPEMIVDFAKQWGLLEVDVDRMQSLEAFTKGLEPIATWRTLSQRANAILTIAIAIRGGSTGSVESWNCLAPSHFQPTTLESPIMKSLDMARNTLVQYVNFWMNVGMVGTRLTWIEDEEGYGRFGTKVTYGPRCQLVGALGLQLALVLSDSDALFTCGGCGILFIRPRHKARPAVSRSNYCDACRGQKISSRKADLRRKQKRTQARNMHAEGIDLMTIAKTLKSKSETIERWIHKR